MRVERLAAWGLALALCTPALILLVSPQGYQVVWPLAGLILAPWAVSLRYAYGYGGRNVRSPTPSEPMVPLMPMVPLAHAIVSPIWIAWAALVGWSAITLFWSVDPGKGAERVGAAFVVLVGAALLIHGATRGPVKGAGHAFVWAFGIALALALADRLGDGAVQALTRPGEVWEVYKLNRITVVIVLLLWPAFALARGWLGRLGLMSGTIALALLSDSQTALLALLLSTLVFVIVRTARGFGTAAIVLAPTIVLATPFLALALESDAASAWIGVLPERTGLIRLQIWQAAALLWWEGAGTGIGLGPDAIRAVTLPEIGWAYPELRVTHPHNAYVQIALDLGLVGMGLTALLVGLIARAAARARRAPLHLAALTAAMIALGTAWSVWAMWWMATLGAVALACALAERR